MSDTHYPPRFRFWLRIWCTVCSIVWVFAIRFLCVAYRESQIRARIREGMTDVKNFTIFASPAISRPPP